MLETKIEKLIEEAARWKQEIQKGNLSDKSMQQLRKRGVTKTDEQLAAGMKKGSEELLRKHAPGTQTQEANFLTGILTGGGATVAQDTYGVSGRRKKVNSIHIAEKPNMILKTTSPFYSNFEKPDLAKEVLRRHEVYEILAGKQTNKPKALLARRDILGRVIPVGLHNSMNVLTKEAADVNRMGYTDAAKRIQKARKNTLESDIMKQYYGVGYNDINHTNLKKINRQIFKTEHPSRKPGDAFIRNNQEHIPGFGTYKPAETPRTLGNSARDIAGTATIPAAVLYTLSGLFGDDAPTEQ